MLVGHFAPAFLLKRADPSLPLWGLLLATQAVDVAFFGLAVGSNWVTDFFGVVGLGWWGERNR